MAAPSPPRSRVIDETAVQAWFASRGWQIAAFQRQVWQAHAAGESGLIHAPTASGKTLAAWLACLLDPQRDDQRLSVLWITPLRALAADTCGGLNQSAQALGLDWRIELRTGDTASGARARQRKQMPHALVTTPESASLLLSYADVLPALRHLRTVIVDEWHELLGSKRGVQTELLLSRLRSLSPGLRTWGLSATLGNLDEAMQTLLGPQRVGRCVRGDARTACRASIPTICSRSRRCTKPWNTNSTCDACAKPVRASLPRPWRCITPSASRRCPSRYGPSAFPAACRPKTGAPASTTCWRVWSRRPAAHARRPSAR